MACASTAAEVEQRGAYLTDGRRLWRVLAAEGGMVRLENCAAPDETPCWFLVRQILGRWRIVRREG